MIIMRLCTGGTSFYRANLTNANFTNANLKNTNLKQAILVKTNWESTSNLEVARFR